MPMYNYSRLTDRRMSSEIASDDCFVSKFFRMFRYFKCLLYDELLHNASIALSDSKLFYKFKYSNLASGYVIIDNNLWFILEMLLWEKSNLIISLLMLFIIWLKPSSVNLLLENWQFSIIFDYFSPAEIAFTYLSPNFCPLMLITLIYPLFLTKPMQQGKTPKFYISYNTKVEGSS